MRRLHRTDIARAGLALVGATTLWLVVSGEESDAAWVPVRVSLAMDSAISVSGDVPEVHAFVVGRRVDLLRMAQSPPVLHRAVAGSREAPDSVRIEVRAADLDLPAGSGARVRDVRPRVLTVQLRRR